MTSAVSAGWLTYRDPLYGFVIQIPRGAVGVGGSATGATSLGAWRLASPAGAADSATLEVTATTQPSAALCAHYASGAPTPIGSGAAVTGYAQDNLSQPTSTSNPPQMTVILLHARLLTIITLTGQGAPSAFTQRWGGDWSHILATFQPGQGPAAAHPCG